MTIPSMLRTTVRHHMTIQITSDSDQVMAELTPYIQRIKLTNSNQLISAQVTAGTHHPCYNTWCNTSWQMCHTTLFYEKTIDLSSKHQNINRPLTSPHNIRLLR